MATGEFISQLPAVPSAQLTDIYPVVQGGVTYKESISQLATLLGSGGVVITNDTTTNATMYPTWVTANSGSLPLKVSSTKLSWNPSTALMTITGSIGGLTGIISAPSAITSSSGASVLTFGYSASAVNFVAINNAATGNFPSIVAGGSDSNVDLFIGTKSGNFRFYDSLNSVAPIVKVFNAGSTHYTGLKVATAQSTDVTFTLPAADGAANTAMITNGSGVLSFGTIPTSSITASAWTSFSPVVTGFSGTPTVEGSWQIIGKTVNVYLYATGTSNATTFTCTNLPAANGQSHLIAIPLMATDNSADTIAAGTIASSATTITLFKGSVTTGSTWTASGTKGIACILTYQSA